MKNWDSYVFIWFKAHFAVIPIFEQESVIHSSWDLKEE